MKKIKENTKITLTVKQLRTLVKEASYDLGQEDVEESFDDNSMGRKEFLESAEEFRQAAYKFYNSQEGDKYLLRDKFRNFMNDFDELVKDFAD